MRIAQLFARAVVLSATCLALGSAAGCHAITGATEYDTSFAVGDWRSTAPVVGKNVTMSLRGDGNGEAKIPYWLDVQNQLQLATLGFAVTWSAADDTTFDLHFACNDVVCSGHDPPTVIEADARCEARKDGAELACRGTDIVGKDTTTFARTD